MSSPGGTGMSRETVYSSGGWSGSMIAPGGHNGYSSGGTLPTNDWPCAYGTPITLGEINNPHVSVTIKPFGSFFYTNYQIVVTMKNTVPSAKQPRIGVTKIQSVDWVPVDSCTNAIQLGPNPVYNGGGLRCFPEQSEPGGTTHNKILTQVTLAAAIPSGMTGTVFVDWFDPDNPRGSTITPNHNGPGKRDNHGIMKIEGKLTGETKLEFAAGTMQQQAICELTSNHEEQATQAAHAGDNYIVAAHPNSGVVGRAKIDASNNIAVPVTTSGGSGGSGSGGSGGSGGTSSILLKKSDMLTVWRTLWVELDKTDYYNSVIPSDPFGFLIGNPNDISEPEFAPIGGLVTTELARACIAVEEFLDNNSQPDRIVFSHPRMNPKFPHEDDFKYVKYESAARDIPAVSDRNFLAVRTIATSCKSKYKPEGGNVLGESGYILYST